MDEGDKTESVADADKAEPVGDVDQGESHRKNRREKFKEMGKKFVFDFSRETLPKLHELPSFEENVDICEEEAGIEAYTSPETPGFSAIIKHRFSDFDVYEVDTEGNVVHLRSTEVPPENEIKPVEVDKFSKYADLSEEVKKLISALNWTRLLQMAKKYAGMEKHPEHEVVNIDVTSLNKDERKLLHDLVKYEFPHLTSNTVIKKEGDQEQKVIAVSFHRSQMDRRDEWPSDRPKFMHFTLFKEGLDTTHVLGVLAKQLKRNRVSVGQFCISGTKDRRGRTTQRVSMSHMTPQRLVKALASARLPKEKISVGDFTFEAKTLRLGDLGGNRFSIVLRDVAGDIEDPEEKKSVADRAMNSLKEKGFVNYFGLQRFGTTTVRTNEIGLAMIKKDYRKAVELILKPRPNDNPQVAKARQHWWQFRDPRVALRILGFRGEATIEANLLKGLQNSHANNTINAFKSIAKNVRLLYLHSYQSLVWNSVLSKRIAKYGLQVLEGDLFAEGENERDDAAEECPADEQDPALQGENDESSSKEESQSRRKIKVGRVTKDNIHRVTIFDVVLPLPGHEVEYPSNETKQFYETALAQDQISFDSFSDSTLFYDLKGDYRRVMAKAGDLTWRFVRYDDPNKTLQLCDVDRLNGAEAVDSEAEGRFLGMIVEMTLKSSNYATMALREALKVDTGRTLQSELTASHLAKSAELDENESFCIDRNGDETASEEVPSKRPKTGDGVDDNPTAV